jgi:N-methylhydantoinase A
VDGRLSSFDTTFYRRERLGAGVRIPAPAIVLQTDSTTVIPPGADAVTDEAGNIIITLGAAS